jgi:hypothetical protein
LRRQIAERLSVAGLSRFLAKAPWSAGEVAATWMEWFHQQMAPASWPSSTASTRGVPRAVDAPQHPS